MGILILGDEGKEVLWDINWPWVVSGTEVKHFTMSESTYHAQINQSLWGVEQFRTLQAFRVYAALGTWYFTSEGMTST